MDNNPAQEIADKVAAAILRAGRSKVSVADSVGIAPTTFNRKINGHVEFTFSELLRIARALDVSPAAFVPTSFGVAA